MLPIGTGDGIARRKTPNVLVLGKIISNMEKTYIKIINGIKIASDVF